MISTGEELHLQRSLPPVPLSDCWRAMPLSMVGWSVCEDMADGGVVGCAGEIGRFNKTDETDERYE